MAATVLLSDGSPPEYLLTSSWVLCLCLRLLLFQTCLLTCSDCTFIWEWSRRPSCIKKLGSSKCPRLCTTHCVVHNFLNPEHIRTLQVPAGRDTKPQSSSKLWQLQLLHSALPQLWPAPAFPRSKANTYHLVRFQNPLWYRQQQQTERSSRVLGLLHSTTMPCTRQASLAKLAIKSKFHCMPICKPPDQLDRANYSPQTQARFSPSPD